MRAEPVETYEDAFVQRTARLVHVVLDVAAEISAWHGGEMVATLGRWTCRDAAIAGAEKACERFGVSPASSMRIRVRETVTRVHRPVRRVDPRWGAEYGDAILTEPVSDRHVWDDATGALPADAAAADFVHDVAFGFREGSADPGADLVQAVPRVRSFAPDRAFLLGGYGVGRTWLDAAERIDVDGPPGDLARDREKDVSRWAVVRLRGTTTMLLPPRWDGRTVDAALAKADLDPTISYDVFGEAAERGRAPAVYPTRLGTRWTFPGAISAAA